MRSSVLSAGDRIEAGSIRCEGLTKTYVLGEHRTLKRTARRILLLPSGNPDARLAAVHDLTFSIEPGSSVGLLGGNGSGKSTFLRILAGVTVPSDGRITIGGRVLPLLAVGSAFHGELTGRENVVLFAAILGVGPAIVRDEIAEIARFAGLPEHLDTPMKRYSDGMQARLSFAAAMLLPADIYIFDEVLAVVDAEFQERCLEHIRELQRRGRTVIFVSHNMDQVRRVCDTAMWLESGRIRQFGPAGEVIDSYLGHVEETPIAP